MKIGTALKIFLTIVFLGIIFYKIDLHNILTVMLSLDIFFLAAALAIVPVLYLIRTLRWRFLLASIGISLPFYQALKIMLIGIFYALLTPGKIGEFGRAFHLDEKKSITIPTIILEKLTDIMVLLILSIFTIFYFFQNSTVMLLSIILILIGVIGAIVLVINERFLQFIGRFFGIVPSDIGIFLITFKKMSGDIRIVLISVVLTLIYYFCTYFCAFFIVMAARMKVEGTYVLPILILVGNIPITISGLGLRESVGSLCFVLLGGTAADGFVFSLLLFIFIIIIPAFCGYILTITGGIDEILEQRK